MASFVFLRCASSPPRYRFFLSEVKPSKDLDVTMFLFPEFNLCSGDRGGTLKKSFMFHPLSSPQLFVYSPPNKPIGSKKKKASRVFFLRVFFLVGFVVLFFHCSPTLFPSPSFSDFEPALAPGDALRTSSLSLSPAGSCNQVSTPLAVLFRRFRLPPAYPCPPSNPPMVVFSCFLLSRTAFRSDSPSSPPLPFPVSLKSLLRVTSLFPFSKSFCCALPAEPVGLSSSFFVSI